MEQLDYRWATHDLMPPDGLPYIGLCAPPAHPFRGITPLKIDPFTPLRRYHPAAANLWVACGFRQWGMTAGTHAAHMLAALITKGEYADASLYSPQRGVQVTAGAPKLVMDQINVGKHARAHHHPHAQPQHACDDAAAMQPGARALIVHPYLYPPLWPL
jgi:hypothetical protein